MHCTDNDIILPTVALAIIFILIASYLRHRRQKQAAAAVITNGPIMAYAPQGQGWQGQSMGATIPSTYDPNAPPQGYPFNGYGQNVGPVAGGPVSGRGYQNKIIAPPEGAPTKESV
jgi:hypothetical protein